MSQGWINKTIPQNVIEDFLSNTGRKFYKIAQPNQNTKSLRRIQLERTGERISESIKSADGKIEVVPFRRGEKVMSVTWLD